MAACLHGERIPDTLISNPSYDLPDWKKHLPIVDGWLLSAGGPEWIDWRRDCHPTAHILFPNGWGMGCWAGTRKVSGPAVAAIGMDSGDAKNAAAKSYLRFGIIHVPMFPSQRPGARRRRTG
jgi:hypothetical protein